MKLYNFLPDDKKNGYNINNLIPKKSKILKPEEAAKLVELVEEKKQENALDKMTDKEKEHILYNFKYNGIIPERGNFTDEELMELLKIDESEVKYLYHEPSKEENDLIYLLRRNNLKAQAKEQKKEGTSILHCPNCDADLPVSMHTMGAGGRFHCPLCEKYFDKDNKVYNEDEPWVPEY